MHKYAHPILLVALIAVIVALVYVMWPKKEKYYETAMPMENYNYNYNTDDYYNEQRAYIPQ